MTTMPTLTPAEFRDVVAAAIRAPSPHNSQPWRFRLRNGSVELHIDQARRLPVTDPTGWGVRLSCGAAAFNARLAMAIRGLAATVRLQPDHTNPDLVVRLTPTDSCPLTASHEALYAAIARRCSNRAPFLPTVLPPDLRTEIVNAARSEGAWIELASGPAAIDAISKVIKLADIVLASDEAYQAELRAWTRRDAFPCDGVPAAPGIPALQPQDLPRCRPISARERTLGRNFAAEPLLVVLGTIDDRPTDHLLAGMALQRLLLTITDAGLVASMLSQAIEVPATREMLRLALGQYGTPQMVLRIGYGRPGALTPRRDLDDVIDEG